MGDIRRIHFRREPIVQARDELVADAEDAIDDIDRRGEPDAPRCGF